LAKKALVIVPTYNEKENIARIVPAILAQDPSLEVLVVDDGSPDGTGAIVDAMAAEDPRIHGIHRAGKLGLGTAYIAGFKWALARDYGLVFEMDAREDHPRMSILALGGGAALNVFEVEAADMIGDRRKYLVALIVPNFDKLERDATGMGVTFRSREDLVANDRVRELYQREIDRFNSNLDRQEKIRRFALLPRDFTIDADEITPSLKVKRKMIDKKYKDIIDKLYSDEGMDDEREAKHA